MNKRFKKGGNAGGTSFHNTTVRTTGNALIEALGEPHGSDGYKVSTEWVFINVKTGAVFTLYDYKETNLYDPFLPSVEQFRNWEYDFHVGSASSEAEEREFADWVRSQL